MDNGRQTAGARRRMLDERRDTQDATRSTQHAPCLAPDAPPPNQTLVTAVRYWFEDIDHFSRLILGRGLRPYQLEPARAIVDSVLHGRGLTFAVMMARQAGKNELSGPARGLPAQPLPAARRPDRQGLPHLQAPDRQLAPAPLRPPGQPLERQRRWRRRWLPPPRGLHRRARPRPRPLLLRRAHRQRRRRHRRPAAGGRRGPGHRRGKVVQGLLAHGRQHQRHHRPLRHGLDRRHAAGPDHPAPAPAGNTRRAPPRLCRTTPTRSPRCVPAYGRYVEQQVARLGRDHP